MMGEFFVEGLVYCLARAWIITVDFFKVTESERERQVRCLRERGEELFREGHYEEAEAQLQAAARLNRLCPPWEYRGAWPIIVDLFKVTESERERQVRSLRKRGEELFRESHHEEAEAQFQAATRLNRLCPPWECRGKRNS